MKKEHNVAKIFLPDTNSYMQNKNWLEKNFPEKIRPAVQIYKPLTLNENALNKEVLLLVRIDLTNDNKKVKVNEISLYKA